MVRVAWSHLCPEGFAFLSLGCRAGPAGKAAFGGQGQHWTGPFSVRTPLRWWLLGAGPAASSHRSAVATTREAGGALMAVRAVTCQTSG